MTGRTPVRWVAGVLAAAVLLTHAPRVDAKVRIIPTVGGGYQKGALLFTGGVQLTVHERFEVGGEIGYTGTSMASNATVRALTLLAPVRFNAYHSDKANLYVQGLAGYVSFDAAGVGADGLGFGAGAGANWEGYDGWVRGGIGLDVLAHTTDVQLDGTAILVRLVLSVGIGVPLE